jgi:hypothetical protein
MKFPPNNPGAENGKLIDHLATNKQFESYFLKALYNAKIEQIIQTYKNKVFSCFTHVKKDDVQFDVIVENHEKAIAFEIF